MPEEVRQKKVNRTTASNHKNVYAMSLLQEITGRLKNGILMKDIPEQLLLGLDSDTFYIYHVAAVMVDNLRRLLLGINLSDKAIMDFDFPGVGFPV